ncbi:MAG: type III-A CRISPR-associated protein Csm2, partial [Candidatus Hodarchaeota archaeon]
KMLVRNHVPTSQLRKFYFDVKRLPIEYTEARYDLQMIRPRLAYAKGKNHKLSDFQKVMESLITTISTNEDLEGFKDFFEAIIAYHKAEGGRD